MTTYEQIMTTLNQQQARLISSRAEIEDALHQAKRRQEMAALEVRHLELRLDQMREEIAMQAGRMAQADAMAGDTTADAPTAEQAT